MRFNDAEHMNCVPLVRWALEEDIGAVERLDWGEYGDITSRVTLPPDLMGQAAITARSRGVVAGLPAVSLVTGEMEPPLSFRPEIQDGELVDPGFQLAILAGSMASLLAAERTALNFLQRLSGIATLTRQYVDAVAGLPVQILDTRKTTPGWRLLEKYAVRCGGGHNHRIGLYDGVLIKDNHLAALGGGPGAVVEAVNRARDLLSQEAHRRRELVEDELPARFVEVEVDTLDQLDAALAVGPDIVLLDNMSLDQMREAVRRRNAVAPSIKLEASGGVNLQTVRGIAETGVDRISVGALTHSAPALDIALDYLG